MEIYGINKMKKIIITCMLSAVLSGCSSIVSKTDYSVAIASTPDAANFVINNKKGQKVHSGVTPATVTLKSSSGYFSGESYTIVFNKEGYPEKTFTMKSSVDGWYFGNILFGGLIGMLIVDPATGAMYNLPKRVDVSLDQSTSESQQKEITVATIDSLTIEERARLVKIN